MKYNPVKFKTREEAVHAILQDKSTGCRSRKEAEAYMAGHTPLEKYWQRKILLWIRENYPDAMAWKAAAGPYSRAGIPDISVIWRGMYIGMEVKRPFIGELSKLQEITIAQLKKAGAIVGVVSFERDATRLMDEAVLEICGQGSFWRGSCGPKQMIRALRVRKL